MGNAAIGAEANVPNPALKALDFLIGEWRTVGSHPALPGKALSGKTSFSWHEGGAFLVMRTQVDEPQFPDGIAIIGSDDSASRYSMIYFDQRGISRIFDVTVGHHMVNWRRDDPDFAQSITITAGDGILVSKGRMSRSNGPWTDDLSQEFHREAAR